MTYIQERLDAVRPYWQRYWLGQVPMLNMVLPKPGVTPVDKPPLGITAQTDLPALADQILAWAQTHDFYGGAFPFYCPYLFDVYNLIAAMTGAPIVRSGDSTHLTPTLNDLDQDEFAVDLQGPVARRLESVAAYLKQRLDGHVLISPCALAANLDTLEALRGSERLLMDLYDNPAGVHRCLNMADDACAAVLDWMANLYEVDRYGSVCRHQPWSPGRIGVPQCDFGYMLSPDMFNEFALPYLRREFARLDGVCYHLDGIGNLPNLETLCAEPNVHLIQWVPGTGQDHKDWTDVFCRTDAAGKGSLRGGTLTDFESWYQTYRAPWQFWSIVPTAPQDFQRALRNLNVPPTN